ncbi:TIGR02281 family clan AA aspartic protease [Sphingomonas sp. Sphisp140]|uniref:retropepsin-like aspartic protease family protein n=1 Tax=unclassified Sphingomonas TaxID=196159 RepID=UPI0039AFBD85
MSPLSIFILPVAALATQTASSLSAPVSPVDAALARWDMAEARVVAEAMPKGADRCVVKGIIANRDNRLDEAARLLPPCLAVLERARSPRAQEAFETLLDTYRRRGEYEREYRLIVRWLAAHEDRNDPDKLADLRNELGTAAMLRDLSRPSATGSRVATLRSHLNVLGTRNVDLTVGGITLPWMIDTGANYSVVSESAARRMHLAVRDASYQVAGTTGHSVPTRIGVIDRLPVGGIILRNVVVIVVPDAALRIRPPGRDYQIEAILGYPALVQLGRFRIDPDGTFAIDREAPLLRSGARLYMNQLTPLAEVEIAGRKSLLSVDTGANWTTLYASYAARFVDRAGLWSKKRDTSLGLGGSFEGDVAVEPQLTFTAGAATVIEHDVAVTLDGDKAAPILGNLGQPGLTAKGSYTFDFRSMRLLLGREDSD